MQDICAMSVLIVFEYFQYFDYVSGDTEKTAVHFTYVKMTPHPKAHIPTTEMIDERNKSIYIRKDRITSSVSSIFRRTSD